MTDALYTTLYILFLGIRMTPFELGVATWQCRRRVCWTGTGFCWIVVCMRMIRITPVKRSLQVDQSTWWTGLEWDWLVVLPGEGRG